jgi:Z1 domain
MSNAETITPQFDLPPGSLWSPLQGSEVHDLIAHLRLDSGSSERIVSEATNILSKCIPPQSAGDSTTGLVLGYVQSGKTMSFTTVAALARDNSYPMVIVITGISNPLLDQSTQRLDQDLRLQNNRKWRLFRNPKPDDRQSISVVLADWRDNRLPDHRRKTVLITVLKSTTNLRNLNAVIAQLDLAAMPVLVIDDEADQAGLNTAVGRGSQSTTYQRLVTLRQNLPHHAYLQYTATPQAPLLINIIDSLSPRFVELLTPGDDYTGGEVFFEQRTDLVRIIPPNEVPNRNNPLQDVPPSLTNALRLFFLGVAAGYVSEEDQQPKRNRSMLVHPSRETSGHLQFFHWISQIRLQWLDLLRLPTDDPERIAFLQTFQPEYDDLRTTVSDISAFDVLAHELEYAIRQTELLEVNARPQTPQPDWKNTYPWILVGGQAMDRGFTVEGLTVTYMPREIGVGNADTIEQRARFFGYKRRYLGYCRVFLESTVRNAFRFYVEHERDIRTRLQQHQSIGRPLTEWRRAFFLDSGLRPTRRQVLNLDYRQDSISDQWFWPKVPHGTAELLDANRRTVREFTEPLAWNDAPGHPRRTPEQIHLICEDVPLRRAYEDLLIHLRLTDERDSQLFTGLLLQIEAYMEGHPDATCTVYNMSRGNRRVRSVNDEQEIPTLFQGANYVDASRREMTYPGDERERADQGVTIQIHTLQVRHKDRGDLIADNVPSVAVWIPQAMAQDWLVQQPA